MLLGVQLLGPVAAAVEEGGQVVAGEAFQVQQGAGLGVGQGVDVLMVLVGAQTKIYLTRSKT
ncbi:hypothetical protein HNQ59_003984 [Chitinivorax tropicus]|uniref:Uncharacterized protein n=1 Tax=Chitinivorax tropicus TaxID=714531 RepID=A0A840MUA2_9PROT|nr:hypothetical protein [Chitinivorax tropicus]MBB5020659.1 hypothetical protein [Chitinivorax tropicus]